MIYQSKPPIGGADLEALFTYQEIKKTDIIRLLTLDSFNKYQVSFKNAVMYTFKMNECIEFNDFSKLIELKESEFYPFLVINIEATLYDIKIVIHLHINDEKVFTVSTQEDFIWNFSDNADNSNIHRLEYFFDFCSEITSTYKPLYAYIGTETIHPEDIKIDRAEINEFEKFDPDEFYSKQHIEELYQWYVYEYTNRWS